MPANITDMRNGKYRLCIFRGTDDLGKRLSPWTKMVSAKNKKEAERLWRDFYVECQEKKLHISTSITLDEFYKYYKEHYIDINKLEIATRNDIQSNYDRLSKSLGHVQIDKIDTKKINAYIKQVTNETYADRKTSEPVKYSARTIRGRIKILKTLLKQAFIWEFLQNDISAKVIMPRLEAPQKKTAVDQQELSRIVKLIDEGNIRHKLWIYLAFGMGLRRGEIFGLQWRDVSGDILSIERTITATNYKDNNGKAPKTENSRRRLYIPQYIVGLIDEYKKSLDIKSKWMFPNKEGKATAPSAFKNALDRLQEKHGLEKLNPHKLRHTFGSLLYNKGVDMAIISGRLGHSSPEFTMETYIHEVENIDRRSPRIMDKAIKGLQRQKNPL